MRKGKERCDGLSSLGLFLTSCPHVFFYPSAATKGPWKKRRLKKKKNAFKIKRLTGAGLSPSAVQPGNESKEATAV